MTAQPTPFDPAGPSSSAAGRLAWTALAVIAHVVLVSAAIETVRSQAPARWWVLASVGAYLSGLVAMWRAAPGVWKRATPAVLATTGSGVFLALLAVTAWLPGGSVAGLRVFGLSTSTLLAGVSAVAVGFAGVSLLRLRLLPPWARYALGALAAYGVLSFALGIANATPYASLFHGGSFWTRVPRWLQGAFVGGLVMVPLAIAAHLFVVMRNARISGFTAWLVFQPTALLLALTMALSGYTGLPAARSASTTAIAGSADNAPLPAVPLASLSPEQKRQIYDAKVADLRDQVARNQEFVDHFPKELVDVATLARTLAAPESAFAYVRDRIAFEPYPGVMKGAAGTLVSRGGNSIDRSLLLAALLARNGVTAKIAHGPMPRARAAALLQQIRSTPDAVEQIARMLPRPLPAAKVDARQQQAMTSLQSEADARGRTHRAAAEASVGVVRASLQKAGLPIGQDREDAQLTVLQDHFWVQASIGGQTVDLDPSFGTADMNQRFAEPVEIHDPAGLPAALYQRVGIRAVADFLDNGTITSRELVKTDARAIDLLGENIRVTVEPQSLSRGQNDFAVTVTMGRAAPVARAFQLRSAGTPPTASGAGGLFGAFGGGAPPPEKSANSTVQNPNAAVLVRLAIELTTSAPILGEARYRRVVMDRLQGDRQTLRLQVGMEDDDSVRTLLCQVWDGAISVGASHPLQMFMHQLQTLKAQQTMTERALAGVYLGQPVAPEHLAPPQLPTQLVEFFFYSSLTHHLIAIADAPRVRQYQMRPRLAFFRHGVVVHDWSKPGVSRRFQDSIDLINLPYGFVGGRDETGLLALKIGVAETVLERAFASQLADFNTVPLVAAAGDQKIAVLAASPGQASMVEQLPVPEAIRGVLRDELARGRTLVLPAGLVALNQVRTFGWWSIDPESGVPLGQMELGAGQAVTENATLTKKVITIGHTFAKFYGGLLGCFFVEAADQLVPPDGPYQVTPTFSPSRGHYLPGLPTIEGGKGLAACIEERVCEAVVELAFLAAETASWGEKTHIQEHIVDLLGLVGPAAVSNGLHGCTE